MITSSAPAAPVTFADDLMVVSNEALNPDLLAICSVAHCMASASCTRERDTIMRALLAEGVSVANAISAKE